MTNYANEAAPGEINPCMWTQTAPGRFLTDLNLLDNMTMSLPNGSTTLTLNDTPAAEDRMRAALGLTPGSVLQTHRPSRGEGPTSAPYTPRPSETSDSLRARLATLTSELKAERSERVAAQQALADAQRTIQQLQTKLAHAEMAAAEALDIERKARLSAEAKLSQIMPAKPLQPAVPKVAEPKRRGRPPGMRQVAEESEPKPVKWWLPSYKAAQAKRTGSKT